MTFSEQLFEEFCHSNGVKCNRVPTARGRTPDFEIELSEYIVTCEVKQIDPNRADLEELAARQAAKSSGRYLANRVRLKLKRDVSLQLKAASSAGKPTLVVLYDNTPFKSYTMHSEVVQAMFGHHSVMVRFSPDPAGLPKVSEPFFGDNRGLTPAQNTAISAIAILDGGPISRPLTLRVYHNPYAKVRLDPALFSSLPVIHPVLADAKEIAL